MTDLPTKESGTKLDACIEWVEHGIAKTLEFDPSGFLLGTEAVAVVEALRELKAERDALREALIRVRNHAHGMPPSKGTSYIIAKVNSTLATLGRPE